MIKLLTFSTLYPNSCQQRHGIFVENRLKHLLSSGEVSSTVIAPVPWFPFKSKIFGAYSTYASVPKHENRYGINIHHPRYPVIPKIGMNFAPELLFRFSRSSAQKLIKQLGDIDIIDAHYFYPDGVAAIQLGKFLNKPVVITARGNDISLISNHDIPKEKILNATHQAAASITVCKALKDRMVELGAKADKITVLRNGVDLQRFKPIDRQAAREKLGLKRKTLLSVGHLIERKGHHIIIDAMQQLSDMDLLIAGDGEEEESLKSLVIKNKLTNQVKFLGSIKQEELKEYYGAVDALVLASSREGWANVLLESMACGTPVVATAIWGTPEVITEPEAGVLVENRDATSIANAVKYLFNNYPEHEATRKYAENFSWDETTQGQLKLFRSLMNKQ